MRTLSATAAVLACCLAGSAWAVPTEITHQGRLLDAAGVPLDGPHDLTFSLYETPAGGVAAWTDTLTVDFDDGYYTVSLGEDTPIDADLLDEDGLWLGMKVDGGTELSPRQPLSSVPYAMVAGAVRGPVDATSLQVDGADIVDTSGNIVAPVPWDRIDGAPLDEDTLRDLGCDADDVPRFDGIAWTCAADADHGHAADDLLSGTIHIDRLPVGSTSGTVKAGDAPDADTLGGLSCADGETARWNDDAGAWECGSAGAAGGNLVLQLELDEPTGTRFADSAGGGFDAVAPSGGIAPGSTGHSGKAIAFSGGYVQIPPGNAVPDAPRATVEAWVRPNVPLTGTKVIASKQGAWTLSQEDDKVRFAVTTAGGDCEITSQLPLTAGEWSHVSGAYNGQTVTVYLDGRAIDRRCTTGPLARTAGSALTIGAGSGGADAFQGTIDEIRLWSWADASTRPNRVWSRGKDHSDDYYRNNNNWSGKRSQDAGIDPVTITTSGGPVHVQFNAMNYLQVHSNYGNRTGLRLWVRVNGEYLPNYCDYQYASNSHQHTTSVCEEILDLPAGTYEIGLGSDCIGYRCIVYHGASNTRRSTLFVEELR